jgi:hypothetical protein
MNQGPRWVLLMKKTGGGKSCSTVPFKNDKVTGSPLPHSPKQEKD